MNPSNVPIYDVSRRLSQRSTFEKLNIKRNINLKE